jgi:hypothetical protein
MPDKGYNYKQAFQKIVDLGLLCYLFSVQPR